MNEEREIRFEEVDSVDAPKRARVEDAVVAPSPAEQDAMTGEGARAQMERKKDYLEGFLAQKPAAPVEDGRGDKGDSALEEAIVDALKEIYDPEIPVNIYDLGLIYNVEVSGAQAVVTMTLTTPHCPVAETMPGEVEIRAASVPGVMDAEVNLVWDPPWGPEKMSDEARLELGML